MPIMQMLQVQQAKKGESFFRILDPKNPTERKRVQQWLHYKGMGRDKKYLSLVKVLFCVKPFLLGGMQFKLKLDFRTGVFL